MVVNNNKWVNDCEFLLNGKWRKKKKKTQGKHKEDNRGEINTIETENQWDKKLNL